MIETGLKCPQSAQWRSKGGRWGRSALGGTFKGGGKIAVIAKNLEREKYFKNNFKSEK